MEYDDIYIELNRHRNLAAAFPAVREKARVLADWTIAEEVEGLWGTYRQMMLFAMRGVADPQAEAMRSDIADRLSRQVLCMERHERMAAHREQRYVSKCREMRHVQSLASVADALEQASTAIGRARNDEGTRRSVREHSLSQLEAEREASLVQLFTWLWTCGQWSAADTSIVSGLLFSDHVSADDKAVIVSAVTLSLMEYADRAKLLILLDCYLSDDVRVSQRALVGFVLAMMRHYDVHYAGCAELHSRLEVFGGDPQFVTDLFMVMTLLQSSCTTDKVTSRMRHDIIPALVQAYSRATKRQADDADTGELNRHGENPEWLDDERVGRRVHEMMDLQLSGADVYYSSFVHMKGGAFFGEMAHWFYPFSLDSPRVPEVRRVLDSGIGRVVDTVLRASPFCDSDKYSVCFTFDSIADAPAASLLEQQMTHMHMPDDETLDELVRESEKRSASRLSVCRSYIFDLYRFYYSYPFHPQFDNPFETLRRSPLTPDTIAPFATLMSGCGERKAQYADFLMRKEFYTTAAQMFEQLLGGNEFDPSLAAMWQKLGFCHQKAAPTAPDGAGWGRALHAYEVADSLKPHSKWTLTHLVAVCEQLSLADRVVAHCRSLLDIEPDNVKYLLKCANALAMSKNDHASALPLLHKAHYLDGQSEDVKALLALCLALTGEPQKAMRHIHELAASPARVLDAKVLRAVALLADGHAPEAFAALAALGPAALDTPLAAHCLEAACRRRLLSPVTARLLRDAVTLGIGDGE